MSTYEALYRKWRPKSFADLVGQEHVARTLSNAITGNKLAHAYLFTGPRGTGKTSSARIFAKSLNCVNGPTVAPCNQCAACDGISRGNFPDVIEIDAASNRGVDDARDLRDRVRFAPTHGRYKVFIIDEVHMLTNEAFNALLKTIEEPPPNLVFVLATTDVHKVLPTIISRCQRFDFQRIPFVQLVARLREVSEAEGFSVSPEGLDAIAKRADGGLRDALSLLDQVRASAPSTTISTEDVFSALGIVSNEAVHAIVQAVADSQVVPALEGIHQLLAAGFDHHAVVRELVEFFRHLMLVGLAGDRAASLDIPQGQAESLHSLASRFSAPEILYALEVLRETEGMLKGSNQMTIWLEMGLMRLCERTEIPSLTQLTQRVAALEDRIANLGAVPAGAARPPVRHAPVAAPPVPTSAPAPVPVAVAPASAPPAPQLAAPSTQAPAPAASLAVPAHVPTASGDDALGALLQALAKVHRSTSSLVEQHALFARLEGETLMLCIKTTMRSFFEKADRKAYLDKATATAFGPSVRLTLSFEQGDTPRPRPAGVPTAPAFEPDDEPSPPIAPAAPAAVTAQAPVPVAAPAAVATAPAAVATAPAPVVAAPAPVTARPEPSAAPAPRQERPAEAPRSLADRTEDIVARAADIFNGRIIEPTL